MMTKHAESEGLSEADCRTLLDFAREGVAYAAAHGKPLPVAAVAARVTPGMKSTMGGFVTLHLDGSLRGCIGEILPRRPLWEVVRDHACNAAVGDPRFNPVTPAEVARLRIEISALTPPVSVSSWRAIKIGRHGVVLRKGGRTAVFLPQVAPEQGWDCETMLTHLAMKAGLPPDGWRDGAEFSVFEAQVFGE